MYERICMRGSEKLKRCIILIVGVFFIGLGVALAKRSDLGISPISSVPNVLSIKFNSLSIGTWMMLWNFVIIIAEIAILRKDFNPIQFLQVPISFLLGAFTDIGIWMASFLPVGHYLLRLLWVLAGVVVIGFGISLTFISNTVMNVGEAIIDVISKKLHKNFGSVKVVFDVCCVVFSVVLSLAFFNFTVVGTREGTLITACSTGFVVKFLTKRMKEPLERFFQK